MNDRTDTPPYLPHVAVVGGGLAGLTAARDLVAAGARVTVLEASPELGGKLRLAEVGGHRVDVGAEAMLAVRPEAVALVEDLGHGDELVSPATTSASIWSRGALHPVPRATLMGVPARADGLGDLLTPDELRRWSDEQPWPGGRVTTDVSVGDYIRTRLGGAIVDRLVEPLLGGVYAGRADELSLEATMPALWRAAIDGGSLIAAATAAAPAPASEGGPAGARPVFAGIRGGVGRLPELLAADLQSRGVAIRTRATVRALTPIGSGWEVLVGPTTAEERLVVDAVIVATPPPAAGRLLSMAAPDASAALARMPSASSAVVTLALPRAGLPELGGSGFLVPAVDGHTIKGATFSSSKWAWTGALDEALVFVRASLGRAGQVADLQRCDADLVDVVRREIGQAIGAPLPAPVDQHVQRWGGGLPQYTVGHVDRMARVAAAVATCPGLEVCGAAYEGVGIPAVIASAHGAAERVSTHLRSRTERQRECPV